MTPSPARAASSTPRWLIPAAVAVVVMFGVLALALARGSSTPQAGDEFKPVQVTGTALPKLGPDPSSDPALGMKLPTIEGTSYDGTPVRIDPADGEAKMIVLVAHWCPHCQKEIPALSEFYATNDLPAGSEMYVVSTSASSTQPNWPASSWLAKHPIRGAQVLADSAEFSAADALGLGGFPMFVIVNGEGEIVYRFAGRADPATVNDYLAGVAAEGQAAEPVTAGPSSPAG
jgi:cytochrome c biogenesis protein CcmG, thiol:disulfide interchange protein DsbE